MRKTIILSFYMSLHDYGYQKLSSALKTGNSETKKTLYIHISVEVTGFYQHGFKYKCFSEYFMRTIIGLARKLNEGCNKNSGSIVWYYRTDRWSSVFLCIMFSISSFVWPFLSMDFSDAWSIQWIVSILNSIERRDSY